MDTKKNAPSTWIEPEFGNSSWRLWLIFFGFPFVLLVEVILCKGAFSDFFDGMPGTRLLFLFFSIGFGYYVMIISVTLYEAYHLALSITHASSKFVISAWPKHMVTVVESDLTSIAKTRSLKCHKFIFFTKDSCDNYCLTTKDGQKFYISGDMPEVDSLIQVLHKIIDKNKEL